MEGTIDIGMVFLGLTDILWVRKKFDGESCFIKHLISSLKYPSIGKSLNIPHISLELFHATLRMCTFYCTCAQFFCLVTAIFQEEQCSLLCLSHRWSQNGGYSEVFQDAYEVKQLVECKNTNSWCQQDEVSSVEAIKV